MLHAATLAAQAAAKAAVSFGPHAMKHPPCAVAPQSVFEVPIELQFTVTLCALFTAVIAQLEGVTSCEVNWKKYPGTLPFVAKM